LHIIKPQEIKNEEASMYKKSLCCLFCLSLVLAVFVGCTKSTEPEDETGAGNHYFSVNSHGDPITFNVDAQNGTYSFTNESTNQSSSGSFTISSDPNLNGVYETSNNHFIIELPDEAFVTSLHLGRQDYNIVFGLTSERDLSGDDLSGNYIFLTYTDAGLDDCGGYRVNNDGTFSYGIAPEPDSITAPFDYFQGSGSGTWVVDPNDSSRVIATEGVEDFYGTIYPGKIMVFSNGPGAGFIVGLVYPSSPVSPAQIAGRYHGIDYSLESGEYGVGYYDLPSSNAPVSYYVEYSGSSGTQSGITTGSLARHGYVNNLFEVDDVEPGEYDDTGYFLLLPGEIMLHFIEDNLTGELINYGIAAKIN
jgi:hypothetical protein